MTSLIQWGLTSATRGILKDAQKDGKVDALAETWDKLITATYPDNPKAIKLDLMVYLVIPIIKILLKDQPDGIQKIKSQL